RVVELGIPVNAGSTDMLAQLGAHSPNRLEQRTLDKHLYASRNLLERFLCRIKQFSRVATRYDKLSERFASCVSLTAAFIWLC
ncbi:hypothetical protein CE195_00490, partial [Sodalis-like symbiont of Philaenus spumarius]